MSAPSFLTKKPHIVYVDGSFHRHRNCCGGWAAIILHNESVVELSGGANNTTNNRMELTAPIKALQSIAIGATVYVYTDSKYLQQGISLWIRTWKRRNWKTNDNRPVANQDLWQELDQERENRLVSWHWVRGHDGDKYNERCDALAHAAAMKRWEFSGKY